MLTSLLMFHPSYLRSLFPYTIDILVFPTVSELPTSTSTRTCQAKRNPADRQLSLLHEAIPLLPSGSLYLFSKFNFSR